MRTPQLRTKLALFYAAILTLLLALASALFYNLLAYRLDADLRDELRDRTAALRGYLRLNGDRAEFVYDPSEPDEAYFVGNATRFYQIYDAATGALIACSDQIKALGFQYTPSEVRDLVRGPDFTQLYTEQVELLFHDDLIHANGKSYLLQVGAPMTLRNTALSQLWHIILWLLPTGMIFALLSGWWIAGRVLKPVESLSDAAREMSISRLHTRLPLTGNGDELDQLAQTFNEMFGRLERAVEQMKEFTASISHELRTPLTALRGEAEVALVKARTAADFRAVLESQLEEFTKLTQMINNMLTLARAEGGQIKLEREQVNLSELARSIVDQMEVVAANKDITIAMEPTGDISVVGDAGWVERIILNLLDNAIKFTPEDGRIDVRVFDLQGEAVLEVRDNGRGISQEAMPHIFERFYRGDPSRSKDLEGAGLGLSLVEWIVKEHKGRIDVESRPGQGTVFRVMLPHDATTALQPT